MNTVTKQHNHEIEAAERWLFSGKEQFGLAKGLFYGKFLADKLMPYSANTFRNGLPKPPWRSWPPPAF
jgi:hypothetical protein